MPDPLFALVDERSALLRQVSELGDFQPGSISSPTRKCGKPTCHCAKPDDLGHGPHFQLTQKVDGHTVTQSLPSPAAVRKAQNEIHEYRKFLSLTDDLDDRSLNTNTFVADYVLMGYALPEEAQCLAVH